MKFKIDENLPCDLAVLLRGAGHDAVTVPDQKLGGATDAALAKACAAEGRALVTLDLDFADIRSYPPAEASGLIVLRCRRQDVPSVLAMGRSVLRLLEIESPAKRLWIVEEGRVRIRGD